MKVHKNIEQRSDEWYNIRRGKVTGTGLKKILGSANTRDKYFYEILAERLTSGAGEDENPMEHGNRLEDEAIEEFEKRTGKIVERVGFCESDQDPNIGSSPDGLILNKGAYNEAVEVKCLTTQNHLKAWLENKIPDDYRPQVVQYFVINDDLDLLHFVLYDPRLKIMPLWIIEVTREELEDEIDVARAELEKFLAKVEQKLSELIEL